MVSRYRSPVLGPKAGFLIRVDPQKKGNYLRVGNEYCWVSYREEIGLIHKGEKVGAVEVKARVLPFALG